MVVSHDPIIFSVFPLSRRLSSYQWLSMEVCGVFLKASFLVFTILPSGCGCKPRSEWMNEWMGEALTIWGHLPPPHPHPPHPPLILHRACRRPAELGGNPGKGSRGAAQRPTDAPTRRAPNMLTRVKSAVAGFMGGLMAGGSSGGGGNTGSDLPLKFPYMRPQFLGLSPDEIECSADHIARPILILKETRRLPWATGYAE